MARNSIRYQVGPLSSIKSLSSFSLYSVLFVILPNQLHLYLFPTDICILVYSLETIMKSQDPVLPVPTSTIDFKIYHCDRDGRPDMRYKPDAATSVCVRHICDLARSMVKSVNGRQGSRGSLRNTAKSDRIPGFFDLQVLKRTIRRTPSNTFWVFSMMISLALLSATPRETQTISQSILGFDGTDSSNFPNSTSSLMEW